MTAKFDDEYVQTKQGVVAYSFLERVAICVESGLSEREAMRIAAADEQRRAADWVPGERPIKR